MQIYPKISLLRFLALVYSVCLFLTEMNIFYMLHASRSWGIQALTARSTLVLNPLLGSGEARRRQNAWESGYRRGKEKIHIALWGLRQMQFFLEECLFNRIISKLRYFFMHNEIRCYTYSSVDIVRAQGYQYPISPFPKGFITFAPNIFYMK